MIAIIIPVHEKEEIENVIETIEGIERTSVLPHTIFLTGIYNHDLSRISHKHTTKIIHLKVSMPRGDARTYGANNAIHRFNSQYVCFCDANLTFGAEAYNWDKILVDYLRTDKKAIVSPGMVASGTSKSCLINVFLDPADNPDLSEHHSVPYPCNETVPKEAPSLCGCLQFMRKETFEASIFGFLPGIPMEDYEFCFRMWTFGYHSVVVPSVAVGHIYKPYYVGMSGKEGDKKVEEYCLGKVLYGVINFDLNVAKQIFDRVCPDRQSVWIQATSREWLKKREEVQKRRVRTTDEYFKHFKMQL